MTTNAGPAVELSGVSFAAPDGTAILSDVSVSVDAGEGLALLGPSGSGKSTLLRLVAGLDSPSAGEIRIGGVRANEVPPHRRGAAMLAQRPALYPGTVGANLAVADGGRGRAAEVASLLEISHLLGKGESTLSGGERQRVALARIALGPARLWLLDEPTAALDPALRARFHERLHLLAGAVRATIVVVTHDPSEAAALADRVGVLVSGRCAQHGPLDVARRRPGHLFAALALAALPWNQFGGRFVRRADSPWIFRPAGSVCEWRAPDGFEPPVPSDAAVTLAWPPEASRWVPTTADWSFGERAAVRPRPFVGGSAVTLAGDPPIRAWLTEVPHGRRPCGAPADAVTCFDSDTGMRLDPRPR